MDKKKAIKIALGTFSVFPLLFALAPVGVGIMLTHPKGRKTENNPMDYDMEYEEIEFKSTLDDITLRGWWIPSKVPTDKTVITAHGYTDERSQKTAAGLHLAKKIHHEDYNILMFDFRNSGKSDGKRTGVGFYEQHDLHAAIDYAISEKSQKKIALLGWSMGAATSLLVACNHKNVTAVIADSPFSDLYTYLQVNLSVWSKLPKKPFTPMIIYSMERLLKIKPNEVSPLSSVKNGHNTSFMIIHGKKDLKIPYQNSQDIFDSIGNEKYKEIWLTEEADHVSSYIHHRKEYEKRVIAFLKEHL